jgi:ABC-type branched-subunit amino acid transport system ATPase component
VTILDARGIGKRYGGLAALTDVDVTVSAGEFVAIIGPNGAGKSTLLNVLNGLVVPDTGSVVLAGREITRVATNKRIRAGLGRTFQHGRTFQRLTVLENVMVGAAIDPRLRESALRDRAMQIIEQMGLADIADRTIKTLSYGRRRMVELARVVACEPKVLLLDEPAAGLNSAEVEQLMVRLSLLREKHQLAIVLIEHNMGIVMDISDTITVMQQGRVLVEGRPDEIRGDERVRSAYLGNMITGGRA